MTRFFVDELMRKTGITDKFALTYAALQRVKQLAREKDKRALLESVKLTSVVLSELREGTVMSQKLAPEKEVQTETNNSQN